MKNSCEKKTLPVNWLSQRSDTVSVLPSSCSHFLNRSSQFAACLRSSESAQICQSSSSGAMALRFSQQQHLRPTKSFMYCSCFHRDEPASYSSSPPRFCAVPRE